MNAALQAISDRIIATRKATAVARLARARRIAEIIVMTCDGLLTVDEGAAKLEEYSVRGGFDARGYTGFDYVAQNWCDEWHSRKYLEALDSLA